MSVVDDKEKEAEEAETEAEEGGGHAVYRLAHRLMALAGTLPNLTNTSASRPHTDTLNTTHTQPSSFRVSEGEGDKTSQVTLQTANTEPNAVLVPYDQSSNASTTSVSATNGRTSHAAPGNTVSAGDSVEGQGTEELRTQLEALRQEFLGQVSDVAVV